MRVIVEDDRGVLHERVKGNVVCIHCSLEETCRQHRGMMCIFANEGGPSHYYKRLKKTIITK